MSKNSLNNKVTAIPSRLLAEVKSGDKERFKQDYSEANFVLDVMKRAIEKNLELLSDKEESEEMFSDPGYMHKYTHLLGQKKMAKDILNLFPKKG